MTPGSSTPVFWGRKPAVSACREGDNLILFDSDRAREKTVNRAGAAVWVAMDGTARTEDLAAALAQNDAVSLSLWAPRRSPHRGRRRCRRKSIPGSMKRHGRWICR